MLTVLLGHPFISTNTPTHPYIWHSDGLRLSGTTAAASKPSLSPQGLLVVPVPRSPPLVCPAGTSAARLVAEIGHRPQPRASPSSPSCPQCRQLASLPSPRAGQGSGLPLFGNTHPPSWEWCRGWQDTRTASASCCVVGKRAATRSLWGAPDSTLWGTRMAAGHGGPSSRALSPFVWFLGTPGPDTGGRWR